MASVQTIRYLAKGVGKGFGFLGRNKTLTFSVLSLAAPETTYNVMRRITKPISKTIGSLVEDPVNRAGDATRNQLEAQINFMNKNTGKIEKMVSDVVDPVTRKIVGSASEAGKQLGDKFTDSAIKGLGALGGAGVGGLIGSELAHYATRGSGEKERARMRFISSMLGSGIGGAAGYFGVKFLKDKGYI